MIEIGIYLLKASLSMSLLYSVYWFSLRKETTFIANRYYLLSALIISLVLPLITIHYLPAGTSDSSFSMSEILSSGTGADQNTTLSAILFKIGTIIYIVGVFIFLIRIMWQAIILSLLVRKNGTKLYHNARVVENERFTLPFSFLKIIFINPQHIRKNEFEDIIAHEKVHIRENHWFDLLLVEIMTIFLWFNPFIWFFERAIKQNHEYLADEGVIAQGNSVSRYHSVLINQLMGMEVIGITNNLNYSLNAKRLKMMKRKKTPKKRALNTLWALPLVVLLLAAFAQPDTQAKDSNNLANISKTVKLTCIVYDKDGDPIPGAAAVIKGSKKGVTTNSKGLFTMDVDVSDIIIVNFIGFDKGVIYMEKVIAKNGKSDEYKLKLKLVASSEKKVMKPNGAENEVKKLELMLKELTIKNDELSKIKKKISAVEKEGKTDPEKLAEKKASLKKEYMAVTQKMEKIEAKLKSLKK